jgi:hypothetical protein
MGMSILTDTVKDASIPLKSYFIDCVHYQIPSDFLKFIFRMNIIPNQKLWKSEIFFIVS